MSKLPSSSQLLRRRPRASYVLGALLTAIAAALLVSGATSTPTDFDPGKAPFVVLNRDGRVDKRDALFLYKFVNGLQEEPWFKPMLGGLGAYDRTAAHGPFVHVDVRGFLAHWGA